MPSCLSCNLARNWKREGVGNRVHLSLRLSVASLAFALASALSFGVGCDGGHNAPPATALHDQAAASSQQREAPEQNFQTRSAALSLWPADAAWLAVTRGGASIGDPHGDTAGVPGSSRDIEGSELVPGAYVAANAAQLFFRLRLGATPVSDGALSPWVWGCLLDTDGRADTYEYMVTVNGTAVGGAVEFRKNSTTVTFDSPADAADAAPLATYSALTDNSVGTTLSHARVVSAGTSIGGGSDTFLDFAIDQSHFQAAGLNASIAVRLVCGTSTAASSLDDDLLGSATSRSLATLISDNISLGIDAAALYQPVCPGGLTCFFMPAMLPAPSSYGDGYASLGGGDLAFASPTVAATITYKYGGQATTYTQNIGAGSKFIQLLTGGSYGFVSGFGVTEQRGVFVTSTARDLIAEQRYTTVYWQSSSTIKMDTVALGTRFRVAGYSLNGNGGDNTGWDYLSFYAPWRTTVTVAAPSAAPSNIWNGASRTVTINLAAGQTYILKSIPAYDIDGTLVTATAPISLVVGGNGWTSGCGDTGADGVVPVPYLGSEFVIGKFTTSSVEDVRVVADSDDTTVTVNGTLVTTLAAGGTYKFQPAGVHYIQTSKPTAVFQNSAYSGCEADIGFIPPIAFASLASVPNMTVAFDAKWPGILFIVVPTGIKGSVKVDGLAAGANETPVPTRTDITTLKFTVASAGGHVVTANGDIQVLFVEGTSGTGMVGAYSPYRRPNAGNGTLDLGEGCDDANVADGDGCSSVGEVEAGYACAPTEQGSSVCGCANDAACATGYYCQQGTPNTCAAKLASGSPIPAGHGSCTTSGPLGSGAATCTSGLCNATTHTCAGGNNTACTAASQCVTNLCLNNLCTDSVTLTLTPGTTQFTGRGPAVPVDSELTVTGTAAINGAMMQITAGLVAAEDRLNFTTIYGITGNYEATSGTLTLSGAATLAQYQAALRSVTYSNSETMKPTAGSRTIQITLTTSQYDAGTGHFYEYVASALSWSSAQTAAAARVYLGLRGYLATSTSSGENSAIAARVPARAWLGLQASGASWPRNWLWSVGPEAGTLVGSNASAGAWSSAGAVYGNWASGQPDNMGGNQLCAEIAASSGTWSDTECGSTLGYVVEYGGSLGDAPLIISGTRALNVNFVATEVITTATALAYVLGSPAMAVDPDLTVLGTNTISGATVSLSAGFVAGEDTLAATVPSGLSASFNSANGTLALSGAGTSAIYQAALRAVTYFNSAGGQARAGARVLTFSVDGGVAQRSVHVKAVPSLALVSSAPTPAAYVDEQPLTLTATVTPNSASGSVEFVLGSTSLGTAALQAGVAQWSLAGLAKGTHNISALYSGDAQFTAATSSLSLTLTQRYRVSVSAGRHGSVTPAGAQWVVEGESIAFTIAPAGGYTIASVVVDEVSLGSVTGHSFTQVTTNHTLAATFVPLPPELTSPAAEALLSDATPSVSGHCISGAQVMVREASTPLCTTACNGGLFTCTTPPLSEGSHTLVASQTDADGLTSASSGAVEFTIDITAPAAPVITAPLSASFVRSALQTARGACETDTLVTVVADSVPICSLICAQGGFECALPLLADGVHALLAVATDAAGNHSDTAAASANSSFTVDTLPPAPPRIDAPQPGATLHVRNAAVQGSCETGATVSVAALPGGATLLCSALCIAEQFSCASAPLAEGSHRVVAWQTDLAGHESAASAEVMFTVETFYTITTDAVAYGTVVCTSPVDYGAAATCSITPEPGYALFSLLDNGQEVSAQVVPPAASGSATYTLAQVTAAHRIVVIFKKALGTPCAAASECLVGFCSDGVCCDRTCSGQCEACDVAGQAGLCQPVLGVPRGGRTLCETDGSVCGAQCNGVEAAACELPAASTPCSAASCAAGVLTLPAVCNGAGGCQPTGQVECPTAKCNETLDGCANDCAPGDTECEAAAAAAEGRAYSAAFGCNATTGTDGWTALLVVAAVARILVRARGRSSNLRGGAACVRRG